MTPIDRIAQLRDAFTTTLQGLSQAREAIHQMEAELLDWAEEAGDLHAYQQADEPIDLLPTATVERQKPDDIDPRKPAADVETETAAPTESTPDPVEPTPEPTEAEPTTDQATEPAPEPEPVSLEQVRAKLAALSAAGHTAQVQQLIQGRGVAKLSDIAPEDYPGLLADADGIAA